MGALGLSLLVTASPASASPTPVCTGATCTVTFLTPGLGQTWVVPTGVTSESITLFGAIGGSNPNHSILGGAGAEVTGTLSMATGATLTVDVGGNGNGLSGGANGGGDGFRGGNGGRARQAP